MWVQLAHNDFPISFSEPECWTLLVILMSIPELRWDVSKEWILLENLWHNNISFTCSQSEMTLWYSSNSLGILYLKCITVSNNCTIIWPRQELVVHHFIQKCLFQWIFTCQILIIKIARALSHIEGNYVPGVVCRGPEQWKEFVFESVRFQGAGTMRYCWSPWVQGVNLGLGENKTKILLDPVF